MAVDEEVISLLKEASFKEYVLGSTLVYCNEADSARQMAYLCFITDYDNPLEAQAAEVLGDFFLQAMEKGTPEYKTKGSLIRAFRSARTDKPEPHFARAHHKLIFNIPLVFPAGENGENSLKYVLKLVDKGLASPLVRIPEENVPVVEQARAETMHEIQERMMNHGGRARSLFNRKYFANLPLSEEDEARIVKKASADNLLEMFDAFLERSFPIVLFSGDMSPKTLETLLIPFMQKYAGNGNKSVLTEPVIEQLPKAGEPVFEKGPSDKMIFIRGYPLKEVPGNEREKYLLFMLGYILGGSWKSPLMQIIREKHNLVYGIFSSYFPERNMVAIETNHDPLFYDKIAELSGEIAGGVLEGNVTEEQVGWARSDLLERKVITYSGSLVSCNQPSYRITDAFNRFILKKSKLSLKDGYKMIDSIGIDDLKSAAGKFFDTNENQIFTYSKTGRVK